MKDIKSLIESDLYRYCGAKDRKNYIKNYIKNYGFRYTVINRKCNFHFYSKHNIRFNIYRMILKRYQTKLLTWIPYNMEIGEGLYIGHIGGIYINPKSKIGRNVNIMQGVTLGYEPRGKRKGCPTIGDEVWIGINACVVGNINIGNNVLIAPNSLVNFDVPDNSIVVGNPAKIIYRENATEGYINERC